MVKVFEDEKFYGAEDVRQKLDIDRKLYTKLVTEGVLPTIRIGQRTRRHYGAELNQFIEDSREFKRAG